jgi:hypothetical protein
MNDNQMGRRQLLIGAGVGAAGALAALHGTASVAAAGPDDSQDRGDGRPEGTWHVTVNVTSPAATTFDALYSFARGGAFVRVDGRKNTFVPALGTWRSVEDGIEFSFVLFSFDATGARNGTITVPSHGSIVDGSLRGTFTAYGVQNDGTTPLPGFPKSGTVTGTRVRTDQAS